MDTIADSSTRNTAKGDTTAAQNAHLRNAAVRNLDNQNAVERSIRIVEAGADHPDKLTDRQRQRIARAAAKLPPLTPEQIAAAGRLAAEIDAKRGPRE